jgi:RNA polymerase sigma-70 factor (ECF subfamily)
MQPDAQRQIEMSAAAAHEASLVRRAQTGDKDAFDALVDRHLPRVLALCQRLSGSREEAEDAAQEAFLRAWRGLAQFDASRSFAPWIVTVAQNALRERWRSRQRAPQVVALEDMTHEPRAAQVGVDARHMADELQDAVQRAVLNLSPRQHEVFVLVKLEGKNSSEVARLLGITDGAVRWTLMEALKRIYQSVSAEGFLPAKEST